MLMAALAPFAMAQDHHAPTDAPPDRALHDARDERPQVTAAVAQAVISLREDVERASINRHVTVGEFIHRLHAEDDLTAALMRAEMVGGPRWVDNDTCEIQLEMSGTRVARILEQLGATSPDSPAKAEDLSRLTIAWQRKVFTGVGSSTSVARAERYRPRGNDSAWAAVSDADRAKAVAAAKDDAVGRVINSLKPIPLAKGSTIGDALADPKVHKDLEDWLQNRPVTRIDYKRDYQVELTMAGTPGGVFDLLRRSITKNNVNVAVPTNEAGWAAVREDFEKNMAIPVGRSTAPGAPAEAHAGGATLPRTTAPVAVNNDPPVHLGLGRPPTWVSERIEVEGVADVPDFKLKGAREAEAAARRKLTDQVYALALTPSLTVGKAADRSPRVKDAVARVIDKARVAKTDYYAKKGVSVIVRMDLQDVWDAVRAAE